MTDLNQFRQFYQLADQLIEGSSKDDIAETAKLLALNLAHYQSKFGEIPLDEVLTVLNVVTPNDEQAVLLSSGMEILVGVLGMVRLGPLNDPEPIH
ncbi:MAG: hypothetical protein B7Y41_06335 [Hydrogenophilales bacterium 28-61-23]|nr:MAG: hypothetical protein B7Y41_06335 [Hydrogenophilales bacterium 28-61-23]